MESGRGGGGRLGWAKVVERGCGTEDPWRGSVGRSCVKRFRRGVPDLGGVFERGRCGVRPTGATKSEDCAGAGGRPTRCWNEVCVHPMVSGALWVGLLVDC